MDQTQCIQIDGSLHEGGGQIFRTSLALAVILQKRLRIVNIRKNRPNPGINNQLKSVIDLIIQIVPCKVSNCKNGVTELEFYPQGPCEGGEIHCGGNTAQSINLMLQCLFPILIYAKKPSVLQLRGGTTVSKSPPSDSMEFLFMPLLKRMNAQVTYQVVKAGYYPAGGGLVKVTVQPGSLQPLIVIEKEKPTRGQVHLYLTKDIPFKDMFKEIQKSIEQELGIQSHSELEFKVSSRIVPNKKFKEIYGIVANVASDTNIFDFSVLQQDEVLTDVYIQLDIKQLLELVQDRIHHELKQLGCMDEFHQDQFLIFMALAKGKSVIRVNKPLTDHTKAALYVIKSFIPDIQIEVNESLGDYIMISITGVGL